MASWINKCKSYQEFEKYMEQEQHKLDSIVTSVIEQFTSREIGRASCRERV
jgi:hypothetical protein